MMFLITCGDRPIILTETLADAEELAIDLELDGQYQRFCALMLHNSCYPTPAWALQIIKNQSWNYKIYEIGVI